MTAHLEKNLRELRRNIEKNAPRITKKLSRAGVQADKGVILSLAKYYPALKKLAAE